MVAEYPADSPLGGSSRLPLPAETVRCVREACRRDRLFSPDVPALVMVSGGQDSLAMLHMLATGSLGEVGPARVHVVHVNHALRGQESDDDQALVETHCATLGAPLTVVRAAVSKGAGNVQEVARDARRAAARRAAADVGAGCVALGHTLDDQVETLLYRLGRYGGLDALAAMRARSGLWVRPLLTRRRAETAAYCAAHGLAYATDRGNESQAYARTAIRAHVLPAWEAALPGAVGAAGRAAAVAAEAADLIAEIVREARASCGVREGDQEEFSAARLARLTMAQRRAFLHSLLEGLEGAHRGRDLVVAAEALLEHSGSGSVAAGGGWRILKEYDRVRVLKEEEEGVAPRDAGPAAAEGSVSLSVPGSVVWNGVRVAAEWVGGMRAHDPLREVYVDVRALRGPVVVRGVLPGDRMRPLGAPGSRKIQDLMVDLRVPQAVRRRVPLVLSAGEPVWLCGLVMAERGRIRADTEQAVRLFVEVV